MSTAAGRGRPVRQGAKRRWPWWAVVAVVVLPVVEVLVLVLVTRWIGLLPTLLVLLVGTLLGGWLVAREVPRTWRALREGLGTGSVDVQGVRVARAPTRLPSKELADGALVLVGGVLLLLPGLVTDVLALICLLPFTRPLPRRLLTAVLARRAAGLATRVRGYRQPPVAGEVLEGTVIEPGPEDGYFRKGPERPR